eukprot:TRINITY_DN30866_c0_g1_i1.p1 TRINITY_DN30866_c0_g1~~TRINITY_DN30866_c0_g1_i1.p1  ORF type:complete len:567 (+),score=24.50 TRINITY_DN30866_c0_g1_i1:49-1749(+)
MIVGSDCVPLCHEDGRDSKVDSALSAESGLEDACGEDRIIYVRVAKASATQNARLRFALFCLTMVVVSAVGFLYLSHFQTSAKSLRSVGQSTLPTNRLPVIQDWTSSKCAGSGCFYQEGKSCQCSSKCKQYGNCCYDYDSVCVHHGSNNCAGLGCGAYHPSSSCQCNEGCVQHGNCCSDYNAVCKGGHGGSKKCAQLGCGYHSRSSCQCNAACTQNGNCCSDYKYVCAAKYGASTDKCATLGCGFHQNAPCQCNSECVRHGNCCADYKSRCVHTCAELGCGFHPGHSCQCNGACMQHGNCCRDFASKCSSAGATHPPAPHSPVPHPHPPVPQPRLPCEDAKPTDECGSSTRWAKTVGIHSHPEWYKGLSVNSTLAEFQSHFHKNRMKNCRAPCSPCFDTSPSDVCGKAVKWAMSEGIRRHATWYPNLTLASSFSDFQRLLHERKQSHCPVPCGTSSLAAASSSVTSTSHAPSVTQTSNTYQTDVAQQSTSTQSPEVELSTTSPPCAVTTPDSKCGRAVEWILEEGLRQHAELFVGLSEVSSWYDVQAYLYASRKDECPQPCAPSVP